MKRIPFRTRRLQASLLAGFATIAPMSPAYSQGIPTIPVDRGSLVIRCGAVWDARGGRIAGPILIEVRNGRIATVSRTEAPRGANEIDLSQSTCLPGLIDAHTHVMLESDRLEGDYDRQLLKESPEYRTVLASDHVRRMIGWGFTSIRDLGSEGAGFGDVAVRDAINGGVIIGPRMQVATQAIAATSAYPLRDYAPAVAVPKGVEEITGADEGRRAVRRQIAQGADVINLYADRAPTPGPDGTILTTPTLTIEEMRAMVDEAHRQQRKVGINARSAESARNALDAGADSIEHGDYLDDDNLRTMVRKGTFYVPDFDTDPRVAETRVRAGYPIFNYIPQVKCRTLAHAERAGVKIAFGSGIGGADWTYNAAGAFRPMAGCGMTPAQILTSATANAAQLLGIDDNVGTLEPGKLADIIAVTGDPLRDVTSMEKVSFVAKGGIVVHQPRPTGPDISPAR